MIGITRATVLLLLACLTWIGPLAAETPALTDVAVVTTPYLDRVRFRSVPVLTRQYGLTKLLERLSFGATAQAALKAGSFDIVLAWRPTSRMLRNLPCARKQRTIRYR